jgi:hypothetical protein
VFENSKAVLYLTQHNKTRQILNKSTTINLFLSDETQLLDIKQKAKSSLAMMNLSDELPTNTASDKPKLKM